MKNLKVMLSVSLLGLIVLPVISNADELEGVCMQVECPNAVPLTNTLVTCVIGGLALGSSAVIMSPFWITSEAFSEDYYYPDSLPSNSTDCKQSSLVQSVSSGKLIGETPISSWCSNRGSNWSQVFFSIGKVETYELDGSWCPI